MLQILFFLGKVKIRNGFNTEEACQEPGADLSDLKISGSEVEGNSPGECQPENAESFPEETELKRKHDEDGFHVKVEAIRSRIMVIGGGLAVVTMSGRGQRRTRSGSFSMIGMYSYF